MGYLSLTNDFSSLSNFISAGVQKPLFLLSTRLGFSVTIEDVYHMADEILSLTLKLGENAVALLTAITLIVALKKEKNIKGIFAGKEKNKKGEAVDSDQAENS